VETTPLVARYAAAKAAMVSLMRSAAIERKAKGIRVTAVLPGAVDNADGVGEPKYQVGPGCREPEDMRQRLHTLLLTMLNSSMERGFASTVDGLGNFRLTTIR
jgi:NAD(P)-dependent dehydrogenase (short-subunit alcohol dehydrogenase family)